jgi:hypothetical protein
MHVIINENRKANALYIIAELNNEDIEVTIDSGANINCIRPDLIDLRSINISSKYQLAGPDKTPLKLLGTTNIELKIGDHTFQIPVCVIENLCSTIILGNEFLSANKAKIDYIKKTITLNKHIKTEILNNRFPQTIKSISNIEKPITESLNIIKSDINILNTTPNYSIAHCISADLLHNTELSNKITQKYGNMSFILENTELIPGEVTTIDTELRTIHYLITKDKHDAHISYLDILENLYSLKKFGYTGGT